MLFLGIDPSLSGTALSLIDKKENSLIFINSKLIKTSPKQELYERLSIIQKEIFNFMADYQITTIAMEETFVNKNANSSMKLTLVRGICYGCAIIKNLTLNEYSPTKIKKSITGNGNSDKENVLYVLKNIVFNLNVNSLDESDATAAAVYAALTYDI